MPTIAEQYYPTYKSSNNEILLIEFQEAQRIASSQSGVYAQMANLLLAVITIILTFIAIQDDAQSSIVQWLTNNAFLFAAVLGALGAMLLHYFVDLQTQITINARKVITLRMMLGLDYGPIHLTLPENRIEGARNPFVIHFFTGWLSFRAMPFWLLLTIANLSWYFAVTVQQAWQLKIFDQDVLLPLWPGFVVITLGYWYIFRSNLKDDHETLYFIIVKAVLRCIFIKVLPNFETIIYRARLAYAELDRWKVGYDNLLQILVCIEDRTFHTNRGFVLQSLLRGLLSRFKFYRKRGYVSSGGSTLTMQLARTLFIPVKQPKILRKIAEILLAPWMAKTFKKNETLKLYVASVRFDRGVLGLSEAIKHFFPPLKDRQLSNEEAFFLVERLSNASSTATWKRVEHLAGRAGRALNLEAVRSIYKDQITAGRIKAEGEWVL